MDCLRRSARVSRLEHISNEEIRKRMDAEESAIERIQLCERQFELGTQILILLYSKEM
jgi:hypothetical protein